MKLSTVATRQHKPKGFNGGHMNFNTDLQLWVNYFKAYPTHTFVYMHGQVICEQTFEFLARFTSDEEAVLTLSLAKETAKKETKA